MANANIFQQYLQPARSMQDYSNDLDKAESNRLSLDEGRRSAREKNVAEQERNALKAALMSGIDTSTPEGQRQLLQQGGLGAIPVLKSAAEIRNLDVKGKLDTAHTKNYEADSESKKYELAQKQVADSMRDVVNFKTPDDARQSIHQKIIDPNTPPEVKQKFLDLLPTIPNDAAGMSQWKMDRLQRLVSAHEQLQASMPKVLPAVNTGPNTVIPAIDPTTGKVIPGAGATFTNGVAPNTAAQVSSTLSGQKLTDERSRDANALKAEENRIRRDEVHGDKQNKNLENLSKRMGADNIPSIYSTLSVVDNMLQPYVTKGATPSAQGTGKQSGKDIPGYGMIDRITPGFLLSDAAKDIRQNVQSLSNQILKMRSGAAVTDSEMKRVLTELGQGNFTSEDQVLKGLQIIRRVTDAEATNIGAGYDQNVLNDYEARTGFKMPRSGSGTVAPAASGLSPEKETRYQELLRKRNATN